MSLGLSSDTALEKGRGASWDAQEDPLVDVSRWLGSDGVIRSTSGLGIGAGAAFERAAPLSISTQGP